MSWIKYIFQNLILILGSCVIGLVLFEIFLVQENKFKPVERIFVDIHGTSYPFLKTETTESPIQISPNSRDLLILGDSFTEGVVCAKDNANFPSHLSKMMSSEVKVINLGVGGLNNADYVDFLDYFDTSNDDLALVTLYDNDIHVSPKNCDQIKRQAEKYNVYVPNFCTANTKIIDKSNQSLLQKLNNSIKHFKIVQLLKESAFQIPLLKKYFYRSEYRNNWNDFDSEENKWLRSTLRVMKQQMTRGGGSIVFTYYPNTNQISDTDIRHKIWLRFIEYVRENEGIEILDPYPYFIKNALQKSMVWSLTDKHPNCAAHEIMAKFLVQNSVIKNKFSNSN